MIDRENIKIMIGLLFLILLTSIVIIGMNYNEKEIPDFPRFPSVIPSGEVGNSDISLSLGWNLISMPSSIPKENISFTHNGLPYSWNEAISNNLIFDILYGFENNDYILVDFCLKTKGYWLYTRVDNLYISDEPQVICCNAMIQNSTAENINCNKVIISDLYDETLYYNEINFDEIEFYYLNDGSFN